MWNNLIGRQIRRGARRLLLWNALLLGVLLVALACGARYWYNFVLGPFPLDHDALLNMKSADGLSRYYVAVSADAASDLGRLFTLQKDQSGRELSRTEQAKLLLLKVDDRALVVKAGLAQPSNQIRQAGQLQPIPSEVRRDVISPFETFARQHNHEPLPILPVMLDATPFRTPGWVGLAVVVPLALLGGWNVVRAVRRLRNPERSPLARGLLQYGDPADVADQIEREYQAAGAEKIGPATITNNWLVYPVGSALFLVRLGDLAWVYKAVTKHFTNGVPTGTTFAGVVCDLHGGKVTVPMPAASTDPFVIAVRNRVPWALVGYDPKLDAMWKTNRTEMAAIIEDRRRQVGDAIRNE